MILILMDTRMPVMDGFQATLAIRGSKSPNVKKLPIIALIHEARPEVAKKCMEVGMNESLAKPIEAHRLISTLARWIPLARRSESQRPNDENPYVRSLRRKFDYLPEVLPGLALRKTLENLGGDLELYLELLQQYSKEKSEFGTLLRETLEKGHVKEATALIHGFKGVTGNLGLERLAKIACRLENALLNGGHASIASLLDRIEIEQEVALGSLKALFKTTKGETSQG